MSLPFNQALGPVLWVVFTVVVLAAIHGWARTRSRGLQALTIVATGLAWAAFRNSLVIEWAIFRHLGGGWMSLLIMMGLGVLLLSILGWLEHQIQDFVLDHLVPEDQDADEWVDNLPWFGRAITNFVMSDRLSGWAIGLGYGILVAAIFLPIYDLWPSSYVWESWLSLDNWMKAALLVATASMALFFMKGPEKVGKTRLAVSVLMAIVAAMVIQWVTTTKFDWSGMPWVSTQATPQSTPPGGSPTATQSATANPSVAPAPTATLAAPAARLTTWAQAVKDSAVQAELAKAGVPLTDAQGWASMAPGADVRVVVVFASKAEIDDDRARVVANVPTGIPVVRASGGGYAQLDILTGDDRVVTLLAPVKAGGKLVQLVSGRGLLTRIADNATTPQWVSYTRAP